MTATVELRENPTASEVGTDERKPSSPAGERLGPVGWEQVSYDGASFLIATYRAPAGPGGKTKRLAG